MTGGLDYSGTSLWLDTLDEPLVPRPRLDAETTADVVIVGAGFIGLWTAYCLAQAEPALDVVVLEAEVAGFGAAGRNAGFASAGIAGQAQAYVPRGGWEGVRRAERAMIDGIDYVGEVAAQRESRAAGPRAARCGSRRARPSSSGSGRGLRIAAGAAWTSPTSSC